MRSEREKMLAGELYDPMDTELVSARERARDLCQALNGTREAQHEERRRIVTRDIPDDVFAAGNPCRVMRLNVGWTRIGVKRNKKMPPGMAVTKRSQPRRIQWPTESIQTATGIPKELCSTIATLVFMREDRDSDRST